ncbi:MAG: hypothetical protein EXS31_06345 [Pedosphaera sp.]|nr:hypothetical protein [Pedosphaera sp.]
MTDPDTPSFSTARRWSIGFQVLLSIGAIIALVVMGNYLSARHFIRFERPGGSKQQLSPVTIRLLQSLTNKVRVVVFFNHRNALFGPVTSLLNQYALRSSQIEVEQVDYERFPGRARQALADLKLDPSADTDRIIFTSTGRTKVVHEGELSIYDNPTQAVLSGKEVKRTGFKGEQLFSAAIFAVSDPRPMTAYFLQGHGEHDPAEEKTTTGYAKFARILQDSNLKLGLLSLAQSEIPADCELLIVAGASTRISSVELEKMDKYLSQGGRALFLANYGALDPKTGLDRTGLPRMLLNWGLDVGQNVVLDKANARAGTGGEILVGEFGPHPIVTPLRRSRIELVSPRSVTARSAGAAGADAPKVTELLLSSAKVSAVRVGERPQVDKSGGVFSLAAAVEKGTIQGISSDRGNTRMVVVGDSFFLLNGVIEFEANRDFARNTVNWLLSREKLLEGIGPRGIDEYRVSMSERDMFTAQWMLLGGAPGVVLFFGWIVWLRRRS